MPNLYFCQPRSSSQATLRAVLSVDDCERLFSLEDAVYVGGSFPASPANSEHSTDFALLYMDTRPAAGEWREGFYRLDGDLAELSRRLLFMSK
jgi:hypothetical protein